MSWVSGADTSLGAGPVGFIAFLGAGGSTGSGLGRSACPGVVPIRVKAVPHSGHWPRVAARPLASQTGWAFASGRIVLQRTQ